MYNGKDYKQLRASVRRTTKIGKRSIHDVITKSFDLSFSEKIDYIRHHFTYYEGNYDLFHDEKGKANRKKTLLNHIIVSVLLRKKDPSVLTEFNKKILKWRKLKKKEEIKTLEKNIIKDYKTHDWFLKTKESGSQDYAKWKNNIIAFLNSPENNLPLNLIRHITYKRLKEITNMWMLKPTSLSDYNAFLINKYPYEQLVYKSLEGK